MPTRWRKVGHISDQARDMPRLLGEIKLIGYLKTHIRALALGLYMQFVEEGDTDKGRITASGETPEPVKEIKFTMTSVRVRIP